ncbi:hypothetical protein [Litchfieldia salsa]|uniref:Uncharacterized protein n=1 Tax=Litchfieldia salsa TaxID=930152 RepID=A0A1H0Q189_9BACI|nr:hypothetical protein [Litchfieldia salsa]SDP11104.1 hypothetical protein SAMN05216565_101552 [Litchfieldia salsa]
MNGLLHFITLFSKGEKDETFSIYLSESFTGNEKYWNPKSNN